MEALNVLRPSGSRSWSAAARTKRRIRAFERGFLAPLPGAGMNFVAVPSPLVSDVKSMARSKALHVALDSLSGRRSHFLRLVVLGARPFLSHDEFACAEYIRKAADKAKHSSVVAPVPRRRVRWADSLVDDVSPSLGVASPPLACGELELDMLFINDPWAISLAARSSCGAFSPAAAACGALDAAVLAPCLDDRLSLENKVDKEKVKIERQLLGVRAVPVAAGGAVECKNHCGVVVQCFPEHLSADTVGPLDPVILGMMKLIGQQSVILASLTSRLEVLGNAAADAGPEKAWCEVGGKYGRLLGKLSDIFERLGCMESQVQELFCNVVSRVEGEDGKTDVRGECGVDPHYSHSYSEDGGQFEAYSVDCDVFGSCGLAADGLHHDDAGSDGDYDERYGGFLDRHGEIF